VSVPIIWLENRNRIQGDFCQRNKTDDNAYAPKMVMTNKGILSDYYDLSLWICVIFKQLQELNLVWYGI